MKIFDNNLLQSITEEAAASPRLRRNRNIHSSLEDTVQRLFNAMEPGTYVRPHRHSEADKWELFFVLSGSLVVLTFDDSGRVTNRIEMSTQGPIRGIELPENTWHTLVSLAPGTVMFEVKRGPYVPLTDKNVAQWAPAEGDALTPTYEAWFRTATVGSYPPEKH